MSEAFEVVDQELLEDIIKGEHQERPQDVDKDVGKDKKQGRIPKKDELNKMLITAIVRRLKKLYLSVPKSEDRILIEEILDDLAQLMVLNGIAVELLYPRTKQKEKK